MNRYGLASVGALGIGFVASVIGITAMMALCAMLMLLVWLRSLGGLRRVWRLNS